MKHKKAIYHSIDSERIIVFSSELKDPKTLAALDKVELWDDSETERLTTVNREGSPHFRRHPKFSGGNVIFYEETNEHNERLNLELENLIKSQRIEFNYYTNHREKITATILNVQDYIWESEVTKFYTDEISLRHDIYGVSKRLNTSIKQPEVAIEIVDSSFLSEEAFNLLIQKTERYPLQVFFVFLSNKGDNYFNKFDDNKLRVSCWIKNGKFHFNTNTIPQFENEHIELSGNQFSLHSAIKLFITDQIRKKGEFNWQIINQIKE